MTPERPDLERLLDDLCQDSLEVPLSHVDDHGHGEPDGEITARFREVRDGIRSLEVEVKRLREALGVMGEALDYINLGVDNPRAVARDAIVNADAALATKGGEEAR